MKSVHLAKAVGRDGLEKVAAWVERHGALTVPLLRRAVRDAAILSALDKSPGSYQAVADRFGVSRDTVEHVEREARRLGRAQ